MAEAKEKKPKDFWDKVDVVLRPLNGLLTAFAVGLLGYYTTNSLRERETNQTNERVYTELMSSRELAESSLRKDMSLSAIQAFAQPSSEIEGKMLNLEMLAYNFHDSLNLKPLFGHMQRQIHEAGGAGAKKNDYAVRLRRVAKEITTRQMVLLEQVGKKFGRSIDFDKLRENPGGLELDSERLQLRNSNLEREFTLTVLKADTDSDDLTMELAVRTTDRKQKVPSLTPPPAGAAAEKDYAPSSPDSATVQRLTFHLGYFDFPMIDNTRLSDDQRAAVILNQMGKDSADITLVLFPGSYASLKERVSYEEVLQNLRNMGGAGRP